MYYLFLLFLFQNISLINDIVFLPNRTFLLLFGGIPDASGRTIAWPKYPAWYAAEANQKSTTRYVPFPWYRSVIKTGHKVSHWLTANLCTMKNKMNSFIFFSFLLLKMSIILALYHSCFQLTTKAPVLRKLLGRVSGRVRHLALIKVEWGNSIEIELTEEFLLTSPYRLKITKTLK